MFLHILHARRRSIIKTIITIMVARCSRRGTSDCKSDALAEWVRIPLPPLMLSASHEVYLSGCAYHNYGYVAEWSMAHAWKACEP